MGNGTLFPDIKQIRNDTHARWEHIALRRRHCNTAHSARQSSRWDLCLYEELRLFFSEHHSSLHRAPWGSSCGRKGMRHERARLVVTIYTKLLKPPFDSVFKRKILRASVTSLSSGSWNIFRWKTIFLATMMEQLLLSVETISSIVYIS